MAVVLSKEVFQALNAPVGLLRITSWDLNILLKWSHDHAKQVIFCCLRRKQNTFLVLFLSFFPTWCHPQVMQYPQTRRLQLTPNKLYRGRSFPQTFPNTEYTPNILRFPDKRPSWCLTRPASPGLWCACCAVVSLHPSFPSGVLCRTQQPPAQQTQADEGWPAGETNKETGHVSWEAVESGGVARQGEHI